MTECSEAQLEFHGLGRRHAPVADQGIGNKYGFTVGGIDLFDIAVFNGEQIVDAAHAGFPRRQAHGHFQG